jgi:hypothetical protein
MTPLLTLDHEEQAEVAALLKAHIPLSLLLDLALDDPHSEDLYANERVTPS